MTYDFSKLIKGMQAGTVVPYLGPGVLQGVTQAKSGEPIPADNNSLILAMNDGRPMSPRLMYEFSRAAMHLENSKGRLFIERFLNKTYGETSWSASVLHQFIYDLALPYIVDVNRDTQLQSLYQNRPHTLVVGAARLAAHPYRFDIYEFTNGEYKLIELDQVNKALPIIFKPLGSPLPKPSFVASDADFVDYITELMGGFAIPSWLKDYRREKQYLFLGLRFTRDTERMIMSDIIYSADETSAGWAFISEPTEKERRFLGKKKIEIIEQDWPVLLDAPNSDAA